MVGFPDGGPACGVLNVTREEKKSWFGRLWAQGTFNFLMRDYNDVLPDKKANRKVIILQLPAEEECETSQGSH
jgi:hypothetical protein